MYAKKSPRAYRTIGEVAASIGVEPHVLRYWETQFSQLRPMKRKGGRRYYSTSDIAKIEIIKTLLHDEGYTIKGAAEYLRKYADKTDILAADNTTSKKLITASKATTTNPTAPTSESLNNQLTELYKELCKLRLFAQKIASP